MSFCSRYGPCGTGRHDELSLIVPCTTERLCDGGNKACDRSCQLGALAHRLLSVIRAQGIATADYAAGKTRCKPLKILTCAFCKLKCWHVKQHMPESQKGLAMARDRVQCRRSLAETGSHLERQCCVRRC